MLYGTPIKRDPQRDPRTTQIESKKQARSNRRLPGIHDSLLAPSRKKPGLGFRVPFKGDHSRVPQYRSLIFYLYYFGFLVIIML